ncbi:MULTISPECIES: ImmA/IrrE family metallo-endopeptidase [Citrobacter]|uniref:ImmA/IrrE family metallo-endopeptidase n=1 Tax=Citrobacter TaxID=544 RepID=UPI0018E382F8|nr:ImmA/IrrE family metallo-endopeptidase [Citrobacter portucalensis]MBI1678252.1 ImmA/IrrE family metallo-endopeptidase [Citrobacter portucalensis]
MTENKPMSRIYQKISNAGFNKAYITKLLPEWWDERLADTPAGKQYASLFLARAFSLSPESLKDESHEACFSFDGRHRFKHRVNVGEDDLTVATAVAYSAARVAANNFGVDYDPDVDLGWATIREKLLKTSPYVTLPALVRFCHTAGIPVVFVKNFPAGATKMAGLALLCSGRPVIVLTQVKKYGMMLFDLAHELGHIAKGHLKDSQDGVFVDKKIDANATIDLEGEANSYAFGLITGKEALRIVPTGRYLNAERLAEASRKYGKEHAIDPTHVALNYGYSMGHWGVATNALKILCAGDSSDQDVVRKILMDDLDEDNINDDDLELLTALCGA